MQVRRGPEPVDRSLQRNGLQPGHADPGGEIEDIAFQGAGCAISKASASLMTHLVRGKTRTETGEMFTEFQQIVAGDRELDDDLGELGAFAGIRDYPSRTKCATLAWYTMMAALEGKGDITTE